VHNAKPRTKGHIRGDARGKSQEQSRDADFGGAGSKGFDTKGRELVKCTTVRGHLGGPERADRGGIIDDFLAPDGEKGNPR